MACFPAATAQPDYVERNRESFGGADPAQLAKERVLVHGPVGAEPLDDPIVPPESAGDPLREELPLPQAVAGPTRALASKGPADSLGGDAASE